MSPSEPHNGVPAPCAPSEPYGINPWRSLDPQKHSLHEMTHPLLHANTLPKPSAPQTPRQTATRKCHNAPRPLTSQIVARTYTASVGNNATTTCVIARLHTAPLAHQCLQAPRNSNALVATKALEETSSIKHDAPACSQAHSQLRRHNGNARLHQTQHGAPCMKPPSQSSDYGIQVQAKQMNERIRDGTHECNERTRRNE